MKDVLKETVKKDRKLKTSTKLKTYRKDGKLRKELEREFEYTSNKPCTCSESE